MISLPRFAGACALLLVTACSSPSAHAPASPTPSAPPGAPSASPSPKDQAIAVYKDMWGVAVEASRDASPDHPDLERYAVGDAAKLMRRGMAGVDEPLEGAPTHDLEILKSKPSDDPTEIEMRDCMDASKWVPEGDPPSNEKNVRVDVYMNRDALRWVVTDLRIWGAQTC